MEIKNKDDKYKIYEKARNKLYDLTMDEDTDMKTLFIAMLDMIEETVDNKKIKKLSEQMIDEFCKW